MRPLLKRILCEEGYQYTGFAQSKAVALNGIREMTGRDAVRKVFYLPGDIVISVLCNKTVDIVTIFKLPLTGFLFHPRSGDIEWKRHVYLNGYGMASASFPYVDGTGWNPEGEPLPGNAVEYPLADDDHGTRRIYKTVSMDKWRYRKNTPENYGNIDWKGWNTAEDGEDPNTPILTWKGPRSRYFAEGMEYRITGEPYYTPNVYESGRVLVSMPVSEKPYTYGGLDEPVPYVVLGAALTKDEDDDMWLVVVAKEYFTDPLTGGSRNALRVTARKYKDLKDKLNDWYHEEDNPKGWRVLYDGGSFLDSSPWHFNASGTEASSVHAFTIRTITVNINTLTARMSEVAAATNISGTGHQEGTGIMTGPYNGWDGAVYTTQGVYMPPEGGIWLTSYNNFVGSCNYYNGGYGYRSENVDAVCAVDYQGDTRIEAKLTSILSSKKEIATVYDISATATNLPGTSFPTRGNYHEKARSGTLRTYDCQVKLSFGDVNIDIYTDSIRTETGNRYELKTTIVEWYGNDPSKVSGNMNFMNLDDEERDIRAGVVMFMDLRNNIAVIAKRRTYSNVTKHTNQHNYDYYTGVDLYPDDESKSDSAYETTMNIFGAGDDEIPWYEQFVYSDDDDHVTIQYPEWADYTALAADYPVQSIHFRWSNQPIGSWAVDRYGNHFYSMLKKDGVYNYLTDGEPVSLTETTGANPVFFPIAPV